MATKAETKHANINAALIAAQAEMTPPKKDREVSVRMKSGGTYKFTYATLAGMVDADKPILAKHGLGFVQFVSDGAMVTRILHEGGECLDCPLPMLSLPNAPQEAGSIITYFKRYSYAAAFGRVAEEEDDANIAAGNDYVPANRPAINGKVSDAQFRELQAAVDRTGADLGRFCKYFQVPSLKDVPAARFGEALAALEAKAKKNGETHAATH
jgi:hypothetical protein